MHAREDRFAHLGVAYGDADRMQLSAYAWILKPERQFRGSLDSADLTPLSRALELEIQRGLKPLGHHDHGRDSGMRASYIKRDLRVTQRGLFRRQCASGNYGEVFSLADLGRLTAVFETIVEHVRHAVEAAT